MSKKKFVRFANRLVLYLYCFIFVSFCVNVTGKTILFDIIADFDGIKGRISILVQEAVRIKRDKNLKNLSFAYIPSIIYIYTLQILIHTHTRTCATENEITFNNRPKH